MSCPWMLSSIRTRMTMAVPSTSVQAAPPNCALSHTLQSGWFNHSFPSVGPGRQRLHVLCMAHPRRVARVSSQIQQEIGDMFVSDPVIQAAICPERKGGGNTLSAVASITNTYVSNDLQVVKVFVSVYSDDYGKRVAMLNLGRLEPYVRRLIGQRVRLRRTPEVRFLYDDSEEEADLVLRVLGPSEVERYRAEIESELAPGESGSARVATGEVGPDGPVTLREDGAAVEDEGAEDEEEQEEEMYEDPDELPQEYPDPFHDLFGDIRGDALVASQAQGHGGRVRGGSGQGSRGSAGRDVMPRQGARGTQRATTG